MPKAKPKAYQDDPEQLPSYQAPAVLQAAPPDDDEGMFDATFDRLFHEVIDTRYGPDEMDKLTQQADGVIRIAVMLKTARHRVDHYLAELAIAVEQFAIWKYLPGCQSINDFWEAADVSPATVKAALAFHRYGEPVARRVGIDVGSASVAGELSGTKKSALAKVGKIAEDKKAFDTEEGAAEIRGHVENILAQPSAKAVQAYVRHELDHKPERVPCFLTGEVLSGLYEQPRVRLKGELTQEQAEAGEEGLLYFVINLGGNVVEFREVSQALRDANIVDADDLL